MIQRNDKPWFSNQASFKMVTPEVMQHIRNVMDNTTTSSWINSVPYNFGEAAASPVQADEWHILSTIYLPLALVSLWGQGTTHSSHDLGAHLQHVLDHTMALVCAITLVCSCTMTKARAIAYHNFIVTYIRDLNGLHPGATHTIWQCIYMIFCYCLGLYTPGGAFLLGVL
jgi:hypothetical protein